MENLDRDHVPSSYERSNNKAKTSLDNSSSSSSSKPRPRGRDKEEEQQRKSKKENRKSTPMTGISSHGSPSRTTVSGNEKSGSGGKRRDHPSGVGAVGGRGSILHNTVNPLLTEVRNFQALHFFAAALVSSIHFRVMQLQFSRIFSSIC